MDTEMQRKMAVMKNATWNILIAFIMTVRSFDIFGFSENFFRVNIWLTIFIDNDFQIQVYTSKNY